MKKTTEYSVEITGSFKIKITTDQSNEHPAPTPQKIIKSILPNDTTDFDDLPDILTVKQVSNLLGWHPNTSYSRCTSGELKSFKSRNSRRIRKNDLIQWFEQQNSIR